MNSETTNANRLVGEAEGLFTVGQYQQSLDRALEGLRSTPDDPRLLRIAGRCSLELDLDAGAYLRSLTELTPGDPDAWRDLGQSEIEMGNLDGAATAFGRVLDLDADDVGALVQLAHVSEMLGRTDEAVVLLERAVEGDSSTVDDLRGLVAMARHAGRLPVALDAARRLVDRDDKDIAALLEVADLLLETGELQEAGVTFASLRAIDDDDGHETYACHGQIEALVRGEQWRRALDVAIDATRLDRHQLTTDLLAFVTGRLFGEGGRPARGWSDLEASLAEQRAFHRRIHAEQEIP